MNLSNLNTGESAIIKKVKGIGSFRRRIQEMGFVAGKKVEVIKNAPLLDPVEYKIMGYNISLRREEAKLIEVSEGKHKYRKHIEKNDLFLILPEAKTIRIEKCKRINVALVGNPNSGKTTLFNYISGLRERVANYSGVTTGEKTAEVRYGEYVINITDLPGTYSLTSFSEEEKLVHDFIINEMPDIIVNVIDASNLERNLFLTTQLIDMDLRVIVALNMFDELENSGTEFDHELLGKMTGIPFVPTVAAKNIGIENLIAEIVKSYNDEEPQFRHIHINYGHPIEDSISELRKILSKNIDVGLLTKISPRYIALKLLENDQDFLRRVKKSSSNYKEILDALTKEISVVKEHYDDSPDNLITDAKYGFISGALKETLKLKENRHSLYRTQRIDEFATHKVWGFPVFLGLMWIMFESTFTIGGYPMAFIEYLVSITSIFVHNNMADGILKDLISDGIIGGVGGVLVFLPNILILFFFISFFEDTGYMSRVVFIVDKLMHSIGLHGKSFIPMLIGFGCSVPAIMATRTINSRKNRIVTMLIIPFMSCGAKLPVYILIIGTFFPENPALILFVLYLTGAAIAFLSALLLKKTLFRGEDAPFVMELPPYRIPTFKSTALHMWDKAYQYLKKMGGLILAASIIIWTLGYFPRPVKVTNHSESYNIENSYIGRIGRIVEPVFNPVGFDWKSNVAIISGFAGKEIVVSTLSILHNNIDGKDLSEKLRNSNSFEHDGSGRLKALSFLIFVLLYLPCIATVFAIKNESGKWKLAFLSVLMTTGFAWIAAFLVYNIGKLL
ncbi:MAG: ferrous iron transport protein B [Candidatus Delongbacteria bacterium]|nr:ferrous iron transport protein B [Candidatus Delongbacteria bacterium]